MSSLATFILQCSYYTVNKIDNKKYQTSICLLKTQKIPNPTFVDSAVNRPSS